MLASLQLVQDEVLKGLGLSGSCEHAGFDFLEWYISGYSIVDKWRVDMGEEGRTAMLPFRSSMTALNL